MNEQVTTPVKNSLSQNYIHYFSSLRCIAMIAVIIIHTVANTIGNYSQFLNSHQIFIGVFLKSITITWAVPIFIMISGALFLDKTKELSLSKLYSKYILRLILVLLTFGVLYALMEIVFYEHKINFRIILLSLKNVYEGKTWDHLWFVYMLIGLYIITPLLKILINNSNKQMIYYNLIILFIFTCFIPVLNLFTNTSFNIRIPSTSIYLFYYIMGYALHNKIIRINSYICFILVIISLLYCSFGQFIPNMLIKNDSGYSLLLASQDSIIGVITSISIFSLFQTFNKQKTNWLDTIIAPLSFGVYIIHMLFMNIIFKLLHFTPEHYNVYLIWLTVFITSLLLSLITVFLLRKITIIRKWLL